MDERNQTLFAKFAGQWCDDCQVAHPGDIRLCFGCGQPLRPCRVSVDATGPDGELTKPGGPKVLRPIRTMPWPDSH